MFPEQSGGDGNSSSRLRFLFFAAGFASCAGDEVPDEAPDEALADLAFVGSVGFSVATSFCAGFSAGFFAFLPRPRPFDGDFSLAS